MGSPPTGATNAGGVGKSCVFQELTHYISETMQDRHIISIKDEQEVVSTVSNGDIADDLR